MCARATYINYRRSGERIERGGKERNSSTLMNVEGLEDWDW